MLAMEEFSQAGGVISAVHEVMGSGSSSTTSCRWYFLRCSNMSWKQTLCVVSCGAVAFHFVLPSISIVAVTCL